MAAARRKTIASQKRSQLRTEFWPDESPWLGPGEKGWFAGPRSLPLVLKALKTKKLGSGRSNLGAVYLELLARHVDEGVVQMSAPEEHAYAAGFWSTRALRDWRAHMRTLEELGFIKSQAKGHLTFGYVFIIHPTKVLKDLHTRGKLPHGWWENYRSRQIEMKEPTYEDLFA